MIVTVTQFRQLARDANGYILPLGDQRLGCQARTTAGAFVPLDSETRFIRLATDTTIQMDIEGGATTAADELFPAGSVEYLAVRGGETLTIAAA